MNISLAEGQNSCDAINRRAEHLSEWVRHECGVSSRLIDEHTTVARRTSGESQLTTRLCRETRAYMVMTGAEKLERLRPSWTTKRAGVIFLLLLLPLYFWAVIHSFFCSRVAAHVILVGKK